MWKGSIQAAPSSSPCPVLLLRASQGLPASFTSQTKTLKGVWGFGVGSNTTSCPVWRREWGLPWGPWTSWAGTCLGLHEWTHARDMLLAVNKGRFICRPGNMQALSLPSSSQHYKVFPVVVMAVNSGSKIKAPNFYTGKANRSRGRALCYHCLHLPLSSPTAEPES